MSPDRVLVVIGRTRHKMVVAELQEAVKRGTGFIELRLDFLAKAIDFKRLAPYKQCPWVATLRRPSDGGRFSGTEPERQTVLRQAIVSGVFEWVDLETDIADHDPPLRQGQADRQLPQPGRDAREPRRDLRADAGAGRRRLQDRRHGPASRGRRPRSETPAGGAQADRRVLHGRHRPAEPVPRPQVRRPVDLRGLQQGARHRPRPAVARRLQDHLSRSRRSPRTRASSASSATRSVTASARCCTTRSTSGWA